MVSVPSGIQVDREPLGRQPSSGQRLSVPLLRFYRATQALNDRSFKMPDFERVTS
jgi:hypothetical protein